MRRIAAVLLLCALLPLWAAGCGGQPSSGEQALSVLIDSEADSSFGPFLRNELPALLDMPVEVTVLPVGDGASQAEMEELEAQRTRVRTQLMSGGGPDLLVLSNQVPTLLQPEAFQRNAAGQQVLNAGASLALARETTETLLAKTFGADSPLAAQYLDAAARVDTARFCYLGSRALYRYVVYPLATGQATAARGAEDLAAAYRYYFSE